MVLNGPHRFIVTPAAAQTEERARTGAASASSSELKCLCITSIKAGMAQVIIKGFDNVYEKDLSVNLFSFLTTVGFSRCVKGCATPGC